jgi:hypothetical protein
VGGGLERPDADAGLRARRRSEVTRDDVRRNGSGDLQEHERRLELVGHEPGGGPHRLPRNRPDHDLHVYAGDFWVFYGALSNVEYTITVTDTQTGQVKTFVNPQDALASAANTAAFP